MGKQNESKSTVEPSVGPVIHSKVGGVASGALDGVGVGVDPKGSFVSVTVAGGKGFGALEGFSPVLCIIDVGEGEISF